MMKIFFFGTWMSMVFLTLEKFIPSNLFGWRLLLEVKTPGMLTSLLVDLSSFGACFILNFLRMILSCPEVFFGVALPSLLCCPWSFHHLFFDCGFAIDLWSWLSSLLNFSDNPSSIDGWKMLCSKPTSPQATVVSVVVVINTLFQILEIMWNMGIIKLKLRRPRSGFCTKSNFRVDCCSSLRSKYFFLIFL